MSLNKRKNSRIIVKINKKPSSMLKNSSESYNNAIYANFNGIDDVDLINIPLSVLEINEKNEQLAQQQHHQRSTFYVVNNDKPKYHEPEPGTTNDITIGSLVEVMNDVSDEPFYGVVRWLGVKADNNKFIQVGVELEEELSHLPLNLTDGTWNGERYFKCADGRALFVPLQQCHKDSRFQDGVNTLELAARNTPENVNQFPYYYDILYEIIFLLSATTCLLRNTWICTTTLYAH